MSVERRLGVLWNEVKLKLRESVFIGLAFTGNGAFAFGTQEDLDEGVGLRLTCDYRGRIRPR